MVTVKLPPVSPEIVGVVAPLLHWYVYPLPDPPDAEMVMLPFAWLQFSFESDDKVTAGLDEFPGILMVRVN
jgi:hypothetical protein